MVNTQIERAVFAELFGFALTDPLALEQFHGHSMHGQDLLALYTTTDLGEQACACGAVVPVLGVEAGYYSVVVRDGASPSLLTAFAGATSSGWVLQVLSGTVAVCGLGHLSLWNPEHSSARRVAVPNGWYRVSLAIGAPVDDTDDYSLEVALARCDERPVFAGDVSRRLAATGDAS